MNKLILAILVTITASCASIQKHVASPYNVYSEFKAAMERKDFEKSLSLLSNSNRGRFNNRETDESFDYFFPFFSSIDSVVTEEVSHFQKIYEDHACLTVVGFDDKKEPTSISFLLFNERNGWKFNLVHMFYYESVSEFPSEAFCPKSP